MIESKNILIVIPARGGSKGIPRKNLRTLEDKPLIYYSIDNALSVSIENYNITVVVSSEDDEILTISKKFGAKTHKRPLDLSDDITTLDSVIYEAYISTKKKVGHDFEIIVTMQATSPLLSKNSIAQALNKFCKDEIIDTIISATNDTHLTWVNKNDKIVPNYIARLNRQELPPVYKETGGFLITRNSIISKNNRIGKNVDLFLLPYKESIDIDTKEDWVLCEHFLKSKKLLFVTKGYKKIGLGHIYNTLSIANEFVSYDIQFLVDKHSDLGFQKIKENNYNVKIQKLDSLIDEIALINPDIIINDLLDTSEEYMKPLRGKCDKIINFEDLGKGVAYADIVINAMYPEEKCPANHYFGQDYFILRDEFLFTKPIEIKDTVKNIVVSFGGVDPNNYTERVLNLIHQKCKVRNIKITVITGLGYQNLESLKEKFKGVNFVHNIKSISEEFSKSDVAFTSAGRTTFELSSLGIPSIVLCQNKRETTHFFANNEFGFINLGLASEIEDSVVDGAFEEIMEFEKRKEIQKKMFANNLRRGKKNVLALINNLIKN